MCISGWSYYTGINARNRILKWFCRPDSRKSMSDSHSNTTPCWNDSIWMSCSQLLVYWLYVALSGNNSELDQSSLSLYHPNAGWHGARLWRQRINSCASNNLSAIFGGGCICRCFKMDLQHALATMFRLRIHTRSSESSCCGAVIDDPSQGWIWSQERNSNNTNCRV